MLREIFKWAGADEDHESKAIGKATQKEFTPVMSFKMFERWTRETTDKNPARMFTRAMEICAALGNKACTPPKDEQQSEEHEQEQVQLAKAPIVGSTKDQVVTLWVLVQEARGLQIPQQYGTLYVELGSDGAGGPSVRTLPVPISQAPVWNHSCAIRVLGGTKRVSATIYRSTPFDMLVEAGTAPGRGLQRTDVG
eukprot:TRINITY_DN21972_c0_g1_i1.p1 TRINITY_DN21972_c0_g1~~TRINITY_DN21972_c0_g1_i1.p1  ORF type:complete len:195 (-),score=42.47 TRINITY_DN21972_c0_g1_i1:20-604(-)